MLRHLIRLEDVLGRLGERPQPAAGGGTSFSNHGTWTHTGGMMTHPFSDESDEVLVQPGGEGRRAGVGQLLPEHVEQPVPQALLQRH